MEQVKPLIHSTHLQQTQEQNIVHLQAKSLAATASLILITGLGAFAPAQAKPDCDKTPDAPICSGEPKPKPPVVSTPQPPSTPAPTPQPHRPGWNIYDQRTIIKR